MFLHLISALQPRARLPLPSEEGERTLAVGNGEGLQSTLPRLARLTEAISSVLDDYTMVSLFS